MPPGVLSAARRGRTKIADLGDASVRGSTEIGDLGSASAALPLGRLVGRQPIYLRNGGRRYYNMAISVAWRFTLDCPPYRGRCVDFMELMIFDVGIGRRHDQPSSRRERSARRSNNATPTQPNPGRRDG